MTKPPIQRILAFVELADAEPNIDYAVSLSKQLDAEIILFAVIDTPAMVRLIGSRDERPKGPLTDAVVRDAQKILQR